MKEAADPAWPFRSYAPGNYICQCISCRQNFDGDKRAIQCLECAVRDTKAHIETLETRVATLSAALEPFAKEAEAWSGYADAEVLTEGWRGGPATQLNVGHLLAAREASR